MNIIKKNIVSLFILCTILFTGFSLKANPSALNIYLGYKNNNVSFGIINGNSTLEVSKLFSYQHTLVKKAWKELPRDTRENWDIISLQLVYDFSKLETFFSNPILFPDAAKTNLPTPTNENKLPNLRFFHPGKPLSREEIREMLLRHSDSSALVRELIEYSSFLERAWEELLYSPQYFFNHSNKKTICHLYYNLREILGLKDEIEVFQIL